MAGAKHTNVMLTGRMLGLLLALIGLVVIVVSVVVIIISTSPPR
jgi:hypothetical protein